MMFTRRDRERLEAIDENLGQLSLKLAVQEERIGQNEKDMAAHVRSCTWQGRLAILTGLAAIGLLARVALHLGMPLP